MEPLRNKSKDDEMEKMRILNSDPEKVNITYIKSPLCFYIKKVSQLFQDFETRLQRFYEINGMNKKISNPHINQLCVAKRERGWSRAIVKRLDFDQNFIHLFFVDYGNEEVFPIESDHVIVCEIDEEFRDFPYMAMKCSLFGIKTKNDYERKKFTSFMLSELENIKEVWVRLNSTRNDIYFVDIELRSNKIKRLDLKNRIFERLSDQTVEKSACAQFDEEKRDFGKKL